MWLPTAAIYIPWRRKVFLHFQFKEFPEKNSVYSSLGHGEGPEVSGDPEDG